MTDQTKQRGDLRACTFLPEAKPGNPGPPLHAGPGSDHKRTHARSFYGFQENSVREYFRK